MLGMVSWPDPAIAIILELMTGWCFLSLLYLLSRVNQFSQRVFLALSLLVVLDTSIDSHILGLSRSCLLLHLYLLSLALFFFKFQCRLVIRLIIIPSLQNLTCLPQFNTHTPAQNLDHLCSTSRILFESLKLFVPTILKMTIIVVLITGHRSA